MPFDRSKYPDNWDALSLDIRANRAGWRCECTGECGHDHKGRCTRKQGDPCKSNPKRPVILTVAHLGVPKPDGRPGTKKDKSDCRPENLKAMCQACHLALDLPDHLENRRKSLFNRKAVGSLFD